MQNDRLKNYFHLHLIVFIWGFTAILGKLISIEALPLVWYRMFLASLFIGAFMLFRRQNIMVNKRILLSMLGVGVIIALHWVTFFEAIKMSNVSITLATMATGSFFTAFLEPLWYKRKLVWYEVVFGCFVVLGLYLIFIGDMTYSGGIGVALISSFLASLFTIINGRLIREQPPSVIGFYELLGGFVFLSLFMFFMNSFSWEGIILSSTDWLYMLILASICTAYAFISSVKVMRFVSPYTVMLTINLEPVYGILLALVIFGESEKMNSYFYLGALVIISTVRANGVIKNKKGSLMKS
ncbi:DMT family transporter [Eudoraea sp.]|uniref:DMT family transporter n=1 Tax=Eudoraea sp. TaxID=1979955 RepID=UPI003C7076C2